MAWFDRTLMGELLCLLLAAPALFFARSAPAWAPWVALGLLGASWLWRRWQLGVWLARTPADWPIFFLFGVMLPVSLWAAPDPLRVQYSNGRAVILVWNFCLFYTVVTYASRRPGALRGFTWLFVAAAAGIALLAPLGIDWLNKFEPLAPLLARIPPILRGVFAGAESGFSGNQVAGTLLYVLPLLYALVLYAPAGQRLRRPAWWIVACLAFYMSLVMVLTQSRGGLLGLGLGLLVVVLLPARWGRWALAAAFPALLATAPLWVVPMLDMVGGLSTAVAAAGVETTALDATTLVGRQEVWVRAIFGIEDFFFTGMGLGTFRAIMPVFYPMFSVGPDFDIAHAHNFFLQTALDFGVPGLVALLAIYLVVLERIAGMWRTRAPAQGVLPLGINWRTWGAGLAGCLAAQTLYSQFDAVAMGAKPSFLFWWLLALALGAGNWVVTGSGLGDATGGAVAHDATAQTPAPD